MLVREFRVDLSGKIFEFLCYCNLKSGLEIDIF